MVGLIVLGIVVVVAFTYVGIFSLMITASRADRELERLFELELLRREEKLDGDSSQI